jgi:glutaredoxin-like YruB-family protein
MTSEQKTHSVTVYSTPSCPYCVYAKEFFAQHNIPFNDIDVSRDRASAMEMIQKSGQMGVPVIDIDGNITVGFRPDVFSQQLGI